MMEKQGNAIRCRAKLEADCYDGRPEFEVYDSEGPGQPEDGTWDERTATVVCDACYFRLGGPSNVELPAAINAYRAQKDGGA